MSYRNGTTLAQNDTTTYVIRLAKSGNVTLGLTTGSTNHAAAAVRLDASFGNNADGTPIWKNSISLSDPSGVIGAAYLTGLTGPDQSANTQDRVFGAELIRIVRTDANGGNCFVTVTERRN